jgi:Asp-tRNA(Asn)/Glu-tRNA(Gln) amidotransferase A subunit family amidase
LLDVTSGVFSGDRLSFATNTLSFEKSLASKQTRKLRVAWSDNLGYAPMEPELLAIARSALDRLMICNPEVIEQPLSVKLPNIYYHWIIDSLNFAGASLAYDGVDIDLLDTRTRALLHEYSKADVAAQIGVERAYVNLERAFAALFENVDILATPATACAAFTADAEIPHYIAGQDAQWTGAEPVSMFANVVGAPALVIPAGLTDEGLPVGLQLVARRCEDLTLLQLAYQYEQGHPFPQMAPAFCK